MVKQFPCSLCSNCVRNNQKGLLCTECKTWVHIKCASIPAEMYDNTSEYFIDWKCPKCILKELPFYDENYFDSKSKTPTPQLPHLDKKRDYSNKDKIKFNELREKGLKCIQLNIVSLIKNLDELKCILIENRVHVCALNETRLDSEIDNSEIEIPGYTIIRKDRNRNGGGVAIYIQNDIKYKVLEDRSFDDLEAILISIELKNSQPILFLNWYRPPSSGRDILDAYENVLMFMCSFNVHSLIMGDTNFDIYRKPALSHTKKYDQMNQTYGFYYVNTTKCTRVTSETSSLIDHMLSNQLDNIKSSGVLEVSMGDHFMNYMVWKSHNVTTHFHNNVTFRKSNGTDWYAFREDMSKVNWKDIETCDDLNDAVEKWENMVLNVINKHMPWRTKRMRKTYSPWLNESIYNLIKQRDSAKKKAIAQKKEKFWKKYRELRNKVTSVIRKAKKRYYIEKLANCSDRNESWKILKSFLPNNKSSSNISCENSDNKATQFNDHFAGVASELLRNQHIAEEEVTNGTVPKVNKAIPCQNTLTFTIVSENDVLNEIKKLKNKISVGVDGISVQVLKSFADILSKPITYLINRSITEGKVPKQWKIAKVIPLHKKGDRSDPDNYRPISLLPCTSKILERLVQSQLLRFLQENNILSSVQSGFRAKHSTVTALVKVLDDWMMAMDRGEYTGAIFVDLKKAFDTVDHKVLLKKLFDIGVRGLTLKWFENYLINRRIVTKVNNSISEEKHLTHGVPQGSILGPLLFCIFINDLPDIFKLSQVHLYADDTVIYFSHKNPNVVESALNTEMEVLDKWMCKNKLLINYTKTVSMLIGTRNLLADYNTLNVKIRNMILQKVKTTKYLGLHIDEELKWDIHINSMCQKISKLVGFLGRLRHIVNETSLNLIYKSVILPHFDYGDIVWQSAPKSFLSPLQKLQNRAGRIIMKINPFSHISNQHIHDTLGWEFLDCRNNKHLCTMIYKILHNFTPNYMSENITRRTLNYTLRSNQNLYLPKPKSNHCKRTFLYRGISIYNKLPNEIRSATSIRSFKILLNQYYE